MFPEVKQILCQDENGKESCMYFGVGKEEGPMERNSLGLVWYIIFTHFTISSA